LRSWESPPFTAGRKSTPCPGIFALLEVVVSASCHLVVEGSVTRPGEGIFEPIALTHKPGDTALQHPIGVGDAVVLHRLLLLPHGLRARLSALLPACVLKRVTACSTGHRDAAAPLMLATPSAATVSGWQPVTVNLPSGPPSAAEARKVPRGTLKAGGKAQGLCRGQCTRLSPDPLRQLAPPLSCRGGIVTWTMYTSRCAAPQLQRSP